MRTLLFVVLVVALGVALGIGTAVLRVKTTAWNPEADESPKTAPAAESPPSGPTPKVVVDKSEHDFGALDIQGNGSHDFVLTNVGDAPLTLTAGGTSCRCTMSSLERESIQPGGSTKVTLTWKPIEKPGPYQQTAKILTNDPTQPQVTLTISGRITAVTRFSPAEVVFTQVSAGDPTSAESTLFGYLDEPLKIVGHTWSNETLAQYFDMEQQPLSDDEVKKEPLAQNGIRVRVTVKAGLPQGPFHQKLLLKTNLKSSSELTLPIQGNVGSEITIVGPGWDPERNILNLGEVARDAGIQRRLLLVVRGPSRKEVTFKPGEVAPNSLKVKLGQSSEINNGIVIQTPLIIEIPKDSPPANHLGSDQGHLGEIILETTHPQVPKLRILVRFAIEG